MRRICPFLALLLLLACTREAPAPEAEPAPKAPAAPAAPQTVSPEQARALAVEATRAAEQAAASAHRAMGQAPSEREAAAATARLQHLQTRMMQAIQQEVAPVPTAELQAALPDAIDGFARRSLTGQTNRTAGAGVSFAVATFEAEGRRLHMELSDAGAMKAFAAMQATGWRSVDIDRKTAAGYERTTELAGHRAFETFEAEGPRAQLRLLVAGRFMIEVEGEGVSMDVVKAAAQKIDLAGLAAKKDFGRKKVTQGP